MFYPPSQKTTGKARGAPLVQAQSELNGFVELQNFLEGKRADLFQEKRLGYGRNIVRIDGTFLREPVLFAQNDLHGDIADGGGDRGKKNR